MPPWRASGLRRRTVAGWVVAALAGGVGTPGAGASGSDPAGPGPALTATANAASAPHLAPARLRYDVSGSAKGFPYRAQATLTWTPDGPRYDARLELNVPLLGTRVQHSQGHWDAQGLRPDRFVDQARKTRQLDFDWREQRLRVAGAPAVVPLPPDTQDRLSLFLQLAHTLAALPQPPRAGQTWTLPVASPNDVQAWTFAFEGAQTQELPAGRFQTWKLQRSPRHPDDQRVELWFAPALQHLPVRMRITQPNGDAVDQRLSGR